MKPYCSKPDKTANASHTSAPSLLIYHRYSIFSTKVTNLFTPFKIGMSLKAWSWDSQSIDKSIKA